MLPNSFPLLLCICSFPVGRLEFQGTARRHSSSILLPATVSISRAGSCLPWKGLRKSSIVRWRIIPWSNVSMGAYYPDLKSSTILPKSWNAFAHYLRGCSTVRRLFLMGSLLAGCSPGLFRTILHLPLADPLSFNFKK